MSWENLISTLMLGGTQYLKEQDLIELSLSEKLQTDPMLTLERAKTLVKQKAAVKDHRHELQLHQMGSEARPVARIF